MFPYSGSQRQSLGPVSPAPPYLSRRNGGRRPPGIRLRRGPGAPGRTTGGLRTHQQPADRGGEPPLDRPGHRHPGRETQTPSWAAFERLRRASQRRNVRLREVAAMVVESGEDPDDD
ncbi:ANTAR domain-containing protein [Tessaracoccus sp. HDW20]|nr:ANTAR domain-containing protein [Tessaracoccus coleopterorum]